MRDISFTKFAQNYFSGHVSWHGHTSAQQSNSAEFSSVSQTHFQSQKRTLSSVFPNPLATFWMRRRTVWSLVLSYWSMQQLANLVKSQTCKESHVHDNVLVFLPNCEYTYQKAFSDLLKICTFFMMVQGRLYVEKKAFWKFFFFLYSFLSSQMNMFTFQIRVMLTDCWFKLCL